MILPIQCFGKDSPSTGIFPPEEYCLRNNKFIFQQNNYTALIKVPNFSIYGKYPDFLFIKSGEKSLKFTRRFNITDEYEGYNLFTEFQLPINDRSWIIFKFPHGFKFLYSWEKTSVHVSNKNFGFTKIDQPRDDYKYYLHFNIGEQINFVSQVKYSSKTLLSVFYNVDQVSFIHSFHPFTPNLLISSCFKMRKIGPFDFFQKINYQSQNDFTFCIFHIIRDLKRITLHKSQAGIHAIKKFKYLKAGIELQISQQQPRISPTIYSKFYFNTITPTILTDFKQTNLTLKYNLSEKSSFTFSISKNIKSNFILFFVKYVIDE